MRSHRPFRTAIDSARGRSRALCAVLAALLILPALTPTRIQAQPPNRAANRAPMRSAGNNRTFPANRPGENRPIQGQHLSQWMESHRSQPLAEQQRALENEPGFRNLRPEQQQRERDLLTRLNAMPPQQRERYIARTETMQRLAPDQRQQVRGAMAQLGSLPEDRRRVVARVFRDVRNMPESQRQQFLNSPQMRGVLTDQERGTLGNLITVSPYLPESGPAPRPMQQQPLPPE